MNNIDNKLIKQIEKVWSVLDLDQRETYFYSDGTIGFIENAMNLLQISDDRQKELFNNEEWTNRMITALENNTFKLLDTLSKDEVSKSEWFRRI